MVGLVHDPHRIWPFPRCDFSLSSVSVSSSSMARVEDGDARDSFDMPSTDERSGAYMNLESDMFDQMLVVNIDRSL